VAAARVGYRDGIYLLNHPVNEREGSQLDLVVAGTANAVLMVESEADQLSEKVMLGGVLFGHTQMQPVIQLINDFAREGKKEAFNWTLPARNEEVYQQVAQRYQAAIAQAYQVREKTARQDQLSALRKQVVAEL